ncbi:MAG: restriction endonuclease subunit S, partial [Bacteroidota bacterium]
SWLAKSEALWEQFSDRSHGTSGKNRIKPRQILNATIPLPSVVEQARLVAKIEAAAETHASLLARIELAATDAALLRQRILDDAVRGRLVPQDPEDEPASVLLERIAAEKQRLVKAGTIRRAKKLPPVSAEEQPYDLPPGWAWIRLGDITQYTEAGWSPRCIKEPAAPDEWGVLRTTAVQTLRFQPDENKRLPSTFTPRPEYEVESGDLLITRAGPKARVGIACSVSNTRQRLMLSDKIIRCKLLDRIATSDYVAMALSSGASRLFIDNAKSGMAESQMNISQKNLKLTPIPLPPVETQHRLVRHVEQVLRLSDTLEARLEAARADAEALMQAVLREAFAGMASAAS